MARGESELVWAVGVNAKCDPVEAEKRFALIAQRNGVPSPKPKHVVEDARSKRSPLHGDFIWRDPVAAEIQRRYRARALLGGLRRRVVVKIRDFPPVPIEVRGRLFVPKHTSVIEIRGVPTILQQPGGYYPQEDVARDPAKYTYVLREVLKMLVRLRTKYWYLEEFSGLWSAIDDMMRGPTP